MASPDAERVRTAAKVFSDPPRAAEHLGVSEGEYLELCRRFGVALPRGEELARWTLPVAGRLRRLVAYLVDVAVVVALAVLLGGGALTWESVAREYLAEGALGPAVVLLFFFYFWLLEGRFGQTPGKWAIRLRVVDEEGAQPSYPRVLARTALRFVPFEALAIFGAARRCLHDMLSGTRVVSARAAEDARFSRPRRTPS